MNERLIHDIVRAVWELSSTRHDGWVKRGALAKRFQGLYSDLEFARLDYYFQTPELRRYFHVSSSGAVKLNIHGIELAESLGDEVSLDLADPGSVAQFVRSYAGEFRDTKVSVSSFFKLSEFDGRGLYSIHIEDEDDSITVSEGTPARLGRCSGTIVGLDREHSSIYLMTPVGYRPDAGAKELFIQRGFLLTKLAEQIETLKIAPRMLQVLADALATDDESIKVISSDRAVNPLVDGGTPFVRLLWGPPGAGKSFALARSILRCATTDKNCKVLVLAPSNLSCDVLTEEILTAVRAKGIDPHDIGLLRYGYPEKPSVLQERTVLGPRGDQEILERIGQLARSLDARKHEQLSEEKAKLQAELYALKQQLKAAVASHVDTCRIVATSTALSHMATGPIAGKRWDYVFVDEVTMVPMAILYYVFSMAASGVVLAGDPRQLGPVFQQLRRTTDSHIWLLGTDIFAACGMTDSSTDSTVLKEKRNLVRIMHQRRCHPAIWSFVEKWYPKVKTSADVRCILEIPSHERVIVGDTSNSEDSRCERSGHSWLNQWSAEVSVKLAKAVAEAQPDLRIGIVVPYSAQHRLIRKLLDKVSPANHEQRFRRMVEVGTVHRFQGSSADVVIFDLVGSMGKPDIGPLLTGTCGSRLMTVAFTRAIERLIILCDIDWHSKWMSHLRSNPLLEGIVLGRGFRGMGQQKVSASLGIAVSGISWRTFGTPEP